MRNDATQKEVGPLLMVRLMLQIARVRGILTVFGDIARADGDALEWCHSLGFAATTRSDNSKLIARKRRRWCCRGLS